MTLSQVAFAYNTEFIYTGSLPLCWLLSQPPIGLHCWGASLCCTAALHGSLWRTQSLDPEGGIEEKISIKCLYSKIHLDYMKFMFYEKKIRWRVECIMSHLKKINNTPFGGGKELNGRQYCLMHLFSQFLLNCANSMLFVLILNTK